MAFPGLIQIGTQVFKRDERIFLQFFPLFGCSLFFGGSVEDSKLLNDVRHRRFVQNLVIAARTNTLGLRWLKATALETLREERVDVEAQRLERVPLNIVLVD